MSLRALVAPAAVALCFGCNNSYTAPASGGLQIIVQSQTPAAQITRVSVDVAPANVSKDLTSDPSGTFSGTLTVAAGDQTVTAKVWAGATVAGTNSAPVTVTKGQTAQLAITVPDGTGPAPLPDHSPVVTSLGVSSSSVTLGQQVTVTATAMDADSDPITYAWTAAPSGCGSFANPAATTTTFTALAVGTCTVTITATARAKSDSKSAPIVVQGGGALALPLKLSANSRYLVDQNGTPFPLLGRSSWFVTTLSVPDYQLYIDDVLAKKFNVIEFSAIGHDQRATTNPRNGSGALPFLKRLDGNPWTGSLTYGNINNEAPDFTQPNETYWAYLDTFVAYLEAKGIVGFMFPAYVGYAGGPQGWMQEMVANGTTRMNTYGAWVANRYKGRKNIVWMMGGDKGTGANPFNGSENPVENAFFDGVNGVLGTTVFYSAEWDTESIGTDEGDLGQFMSLNGAYSWMGDVNTQGRRAYAYPSVRPAYLLEEPYDEEGDNGTNPNATHPVRRFEYWGWLSTVGGYICGNGYVWPFNPGVWNQHLNTEAAQDIGRLNAFIQGIDWWTLVPSGLGGMKTLVTNNSAVNTSTYVAAAASPDGHRLLAYVPPAHTGNVTIDMTAMSAPARARWFNPSTAAYTLISASLPNTGTNDFAPPGNNGSGFSDWLLVLDLGP